MLKRKHIIGVFVSLVLGFALADERISGVGGFAEVAVCGALGLPCSSAVFIGAMVRCIMCDSVGRCIVKLAAMLIIVTGKMFTERSSTPIGCAVLTASAVVISGSAVSVLLGELPEKLLFYAFYGALTAFTAMSLERLSESLADSRVIELGGASGCAYGVVYIVLTAALGSIEIASLSVGLIAGIAFTLAAACIFGSSGGVIMGALSAAGALFASPELGTAAAVLPVSGLITGFLRSRKPIFGAAFFAASAFMLSLLTGSAADPAFVVSIVIGSGIAVAVIPHYSDKWFSVGECASSTELADASRITFLADMIDGIRADSARLSAVLSAPTSSANRRRHRAKAADRIMELRFSEDRGLFDEQLRLMSDLVRSGTECSDMRYSAEKSQIIAKCLTSHDISPKRIYAAYTSSNRLTVQVYFSLDGIPVSTTRICDLISDELGVKLVPALSVSSSRELRTALFEQPKYDLAIHTAGMRAADISGDSASVFADIQGRKYIVLSDGMGTGRSAAVDSRIAVGMFRRLVCGGMEMSSALRLINSVMLTRSRDESFATLDIIRFDPDTCKLRSLKSGAAATVLRRSGEVERISAVTFPIGIVSKAEFSESEHELSVGDAVIMFSDGISENAEVYIKELLLSGAKMEDAVREIAVKAKGTGEQSRSDDITVIGFEVVGS